MPSRRSGPSPAAPGVQTAASAPAAKRPRAGGSATAAGAEEEPVNGRPEPGTRAKPRPAGTRARSAPAPAPSAKRSTGTTTSKAPAERPARAKRAASPKRRSAQTKPAAPAEPDLAPEAAGNVPEPATPRPRRVPVRRAVLGVLTVLLGGFAIWSGVQANHLNSAPGASNTALTDRAATTRIIGQMTRTVNSIFSYNYSDPARTARAARLDLTGAAVRQYRGIFGTMARDGARYTRLVLTTTVTNAGVEMLEGNRAQVLVFGTQVLTSGNQAPQSFGAMVALDLVQQDGTWKIDNIDTFTSNP